MPIKSLILCIFAALLSDIYCGSVPCPNNSTFAQCNQCYEVSPTNIICLCYDYQLAIIGLCFPVNYPCTNSSMAKIKNDAFPQFNIWAPIIAPFWTQKFIDAKTHTSQPNPLPQILNSYNFNGMSDTLARGWAEAYLMYKSYQQQIQSMSSTDQAQYLFQAVVLMQGLIGTGNIQKWKNISNFANQILDQNNDAYSFFVQTWPRIIKQAPCHECAQMYGLTFDDNFSTCTKCTPNCMDCPEEAGTCNSCMPNTYLSDAGKCQSFISLLSQPEKQYLFYKNHPSRIGRNFKMTEYKIQT